MHGLELCINVDSYVAHMFYAWSFSPNKAVPIDINKIKCLLSFSTYTAVFS